MIKFITPRKDRAGFVFAFLLGLIAYLPVYAEPVQISSGNMDVATSINLAGRQRMLSQRMVKAYLMLGQSVMPAEARAILSASIKQFEDQLVQLKSYQPNANVQDTLVKLDNEWTRFKELISAIPSKQGAAALYDANESLQKTAHAVTTAYQSNNNTMLDHLVNIAGRQRMLSQRVAKFYLYRTWDLYLEPADMEMHLSRAHFTSVLIQLESSPFATDKIKQQVAIIREQWKPYEQTLIISRDPVVMRKHMQTLAELSEQLLASTEELVSLVVEQARMQH